MYGLIVLACAAQILLTCLPGEREGSGKYVKAVFSLVILCALLSSLHITSEKDLQQSGEAAGEEAAAVQSGEKMVIEQTCEILSENIREALASKWGVEKEAVQAKIVCDDTDTGQVRIAEIKVVLNGAQYGILTEKIEAYLTVTFQVQSEVNVICKP